MVPYPCLDLLGTILFIESLCFGVWVGLARPDLFQNYQKRFLYFIRKQYAYWKPRLKKILVQIQTKLSQNELFKAFLEKINSFKKVIKGEGQDEES